MKRSLFILSLVLACLWISRVQAQPVYSYFSSHGATGPSIVAPCNLMTVTGNSQAGAAWINYSATNDPTFEIDLSPTNNLTFDQTFEFYFGSNNYGGGDGMAFVIRDAASSMLGGHGHGIGYGSGDNCGHSHGNCFIDNSIAIEFDTHPNTETGDPFDDHIAIQLNGDEDHNSAVNTVGIFPMPYDIEDGLTHDVRIRILPTGAGNFTFEIFFDNLSSPALTHSFTAAQISAIFNMPSSVVWGVTGSTGGISSNQLFGQPGSCEDFLPVEMESFEAKVSDERFVRLDWVTSSEINNKSFHVLRQEENGWKVIGQLDGNGTTDMPSYYQFTDLSPLAGKNRYRLRQIDFDGLVSNSSETEVTMDVRDNGITVYPNPATDRFTLQVPHQENPQPLVVHVVDITGRTVIQQELVSFEEAYLQQSFDITALKPGIYVVMLKTGRRTTLGVQRLIKR